MRFTIIIVLIQNLYCFSQDSLQKFTYQELDQKINLKNKNSLLFSKMYLEKGKKEKNFTEIVNGYYFIGSNVKSYELKLKYSDSSINVAKTKKRELLSILFFLRGDIFYSEKRLKNALDCYLIADKYTRKNDTSLVNKINYSIGLIKKTQGKYDEAIPIYLKCMETSKNYKESYFPLYVLGLSELYNRMNEVDLSEKYINIGILSCKYYMQGDYYLPYYISNKGKNLFKKRKYFKAIHQLKSSLPEIKKNNDFSNYAENCFFIAECYYELKKQKEAVEYYEKIDSIFNLKNDISTLIISSYERLIEHYKKTKDYEKVVYYSDQFIKADKVLDENYKYITDRITKKYDIKKIIINKQNTINNLKNDNNKYLIVVFCLILISALFYLKIIKRKKEINKQKQLFETFKSNENEKKFNKNNNRFKLENIDEKIVKQILLCLEDFENNNFYLNPDCNIDILAYEFKTNSTYLSMVINNNKKQNFTQYINTLRIKYILEKFENEKKYLNYTVQALSESSGFNSVQTFTRAFINYTKMKPSEYIKQLKLN